MLRVIFNLKLKKCLGYLVVVYVSCYFLIQVLFSVDILDNKSALPILIWWTPFMSSNDRIINCFNEEYKCVVSVNRTHKYNANLGAYLFYGSHIQNEDLPLPRDINIPWAIFHEESPKNYAPFLFKETQDLFNLTSTFSRHSDFPITLQYLEELGVLTDTKYYVPVQIKNMYLKDLSPVLYIQSDCDTPIYRDHLVEELMKYVKVDSYGKCLTNKKFPKGLSEIYPLDLYNKDILQFISKYKFILAFENSICDDYITEKLWRALIVGSIPIYFGSPTVEDWLPNNNSAILVKNYKSLKEVGAIIKKINENDTLYESFLEHKINSQIFNDLLMKQILDDHPIPSFECFVCKRMYDDEYRYQKRNKNVYNCPKPWEETENTWYQHWDVGKCQSRALQQLVENGQLYSKQKFDETWKMLFHNGQC